MNKTLIYVTFLVLVVLALIGSTLIIILTPNQFSTFTGFIVVLLGIATTFATTVAALEKTKREVQNVKHETSTKLDVVQKQTNGTLTKLIETNTEKDALLAEKDRQIAELEAALLNAPVKGIRND